jgi:hypothetical protein
MPILRRLTRTCTLNQILKPHSVDTRRHNGKPPSRGAIMLIKQAYYVRWNGSCAVFDWMPFDCFISNVEGDSGGDGS